MKEKVATRLSKTQNVHLAELEKNFEKHVEVYRKQKEQELFSGKRAELENELGSLESYVKGCRDGLIADVLVHIRFCAAKRDVLKKLLCGVSY